jgi:hypothetical protein
MDAGVLVSALAKFNGIRWADVRMLVEPMISLEVMSTF